MKLAIIQPSYVPWRGYFHQIQKADVFVFYDDVQYDKHGWRNRNRVKTKNGSVWLTIPVAAAGNVVDSIPINAVRCAGESWKRKHWATLQQSYGRAPSFERYAPLLEAFYARKETRLAELTIDLTLQLAAELGITSTRYLRSSELPGITGAGTDRLLRLMEATGADHFISGPTARDYIDEGKLAAAGVSLEYMVYDRCEYPEYEQLHPPYDARVSVLDLLFMKGGEAGEFIWGRFTKGGTP